MILKFRVNYFNLPSILHFWHKNHYFQNLLKTLTNLTLLRILYKNFFFIIFKKVVCIKNQQYHFVNWRLNMFSCFPLHVYVSFPCTQQTHPSKFNNTIHLPSVVPWFFHWICHWWLKFWGYWDLILKKGFSFLFLFILIGEARIINNNRNGDLNVLGIWEFECFDWICMD